MAWDQAGSVAAKPGKGQLRCYHCRQIVLLKEGSWCDWKNFQVFLCRVCSREAPSGVNRSS
jgi:hypothetical protein